MIYSEKDGIRIRDLMQEDAQIFTDGENAQGWNTSIDKFLLRLWDQANGTAVALAAEYLGRPAGYINVYPDPANGAFAGTGWPEIVDFGVLEIYRRHGVGSRLMDVAEEIAAGYADTVWLGVGLHSGYGSAQRMYVKRGYIPDGSGVWFRDQICPPYTDCCNDDDLVLYVSKRLR